MSFTNSATVRQHLQETASLRDTFRDVTVEMSGLSPMALLHSQLREGTVVVKGKEIGAPRTALVTLEAIPVSLGRANVIPDSVVVASDTSLGRVFAENSDYHVDYQAGQITRIASGSIAAGASVAVWFFTYRVYQNDSDYAVDHQRGTVRRVSGSQIEDGQVVFVDYQTQSLLLDEDQINNAITEANDLLLGLIDSSYHDSGDQSLITAETYLTVSILCRVKTLAALQQPGGTAVATDWKQVGESYETNGLKIAARFSAEHGRLHSPVRVTGGDLR